MSNPSIRRRTSDRIKPEYWLVVIPIAALVVGVVAFFACNFFATRELQKMAQAPSGALEWLRHEFHLSDAQFKNIEGLQRALVNTLKRAEGLRQLGPVLARRRSAEAKPGYLVTLCSRSFA